MKATSQYFLKLCAAFLLVSGLFAICFARAADPTAAFEAANKFYEEGKFADAAQAYEKIIQDGTVSPVIYFNLGNAHFKSGGLGKAIAAYRQSEQIAPRDPDLRANLQFARSQVQGPTLRASRWQNWLGILKLNEWTCLAAISVWLVFGLLALRQVRPSLTGALRTWILVSALAAVVFCTCLGLTFLANSSFQTAIVTVPETNVRNGPFEGSPSVFSAHDGAELQLLDSKGDWVQVTDGARRVGWVKRSDTFVTPQS